MSALLIARKLLNHDDDSNSTKANHTCPAENTSGPEIVNLVGNMTFHDFATVLSGACGIASLLAILFLILLHATHYTSPVQQRQIIRIVSLVPYVSFFAFLIVWRTDAGPYLVESLDVGCAVAMSAFLLLLCDYILSHPDGFDDLFGEGASKRVQDSSKSPPSLKRTWYMVLQFIPSSIIIWIATVITLASGIYCATSNKPYFAHIWITVLKAFVTTVAVLAIVRFYKRMKEILAPHNVILKLVAFKGIIGLNIFQTLIINLLVGNDKIHPTKYMTYHDIVTALPSLILACEMPIFAILLIVAFPVSPYKNGRAPAHGPIMAIFQALNITDLLSAFVRGPMRLVKEQQRTMIRQDSMPLGLDSPAYNGGLESGMQRRY